MTNEIQNIDQNSYLAPQNFEHYLRIAKMMAASAMVPKAYANKPQDIIISMEYGRSLGMGSLQAIQNIAVINGKPALYGDGILAVCSGRADFEDIKEEPIMGADKQITGYLCTVKRKGRSPVIQGYTVDDAKKAGLWGKAGPWSQYPSRMLQMRARAFALRDSFADALGGVRIVEEVQDYREVKDATPKKGQAQKALDDLIKSTEQEVIDTETGEVIEEPR